MVMFSTGLRRVLMGTAALALLGACSDFDYDLRDRGGDTLDTSGAIRNLPDRPQPDARGVISYPTYQVVVARQGETVRAIATRLGLDANQLAVFNGIEPDVPLRRDEIIALPGQNATSPGGALDVTALATGALDRAGPQGASVTTTTLAPAVAGTAAAAPSQDAAPIRHRVERGESAYSIARLYGVPVRSIAEWNGLNSDLTIREGQVLLIPQGGGAPPFAVATSDPGEGSATPTPPSAAQPLPASGTTATTAPASPDIGTANTAASSAPLIQPVPGAIIRAYAAGRNEGIDIGAPAGTDVRAAAAGTVAAVTHDTNGVAIVVIKHANNLLTVYTNLDNLAVAKDDRVTQGQVIAKVRAGSPSFLHFEVREGLNSVDPARYLP